MPDRGDRRAVEGCADGGGEFLMIERVLGAHQPVPPGEVEAVIPPRLRMVEIVMGDRRQPVEDRTGGAA